VEITEDRPWITEAQNGRTAPGRTPRITVAGAVTPRGPGDAVGLPRFAAAQTLGSNFRRHR
jgi:hypothetical protein